MELLLQCQNLKSFRIDSSQLIKSESTSFPSTSFLVLSQNECYQDAAKPLARLSVWAKFSLFRFTEICRIMPAEDLLSCTLTC